MRSRLVYAAAVALLLAACTRSNPDRNRLGDGAVGVVRAQITEVPRDILCVELIAGAGARMLSSTFEVVPGRAATLQLSDLPVGNLTITAWAYSAACPAIGGRQATWASAPAVVTVAAGQVTPLSLTLELVGGVDIGLHFGDAGDIDMAPPADLATPPADLATPPADLATPPDLADPCSACGTGQLCGQGRCVDPTSDPNNCGACGTVCAGGCGSTLTGAPAGWSFNGNAAYDTALSSMVLTPGVAGQAGSAVYKQPVRTTDFDVVFDFRISTPVTSSQPADGMGFMIEREGAAAIGTGGGGFGMATLTGYGVELDTFSNANPATGSGGCGDSNGNHTSIDSLSPCTDFAGHFVPTKLAGGSELALSTPPLHLADGLWHTAHVTLSHGQMSVTIDALSRAFLSALPAFVPGTLYYFGFAGGTGGFFSRQEVRNITITLPTPQCL
jgi:hypothetical protein